MVSDFMAVPPIRPFHEKAIVNAAVYAWTSRTCTSFLLSKRTFNKLKELFYIIGRQ